jgi:hypothetical protein
LTAVTAHENRYRREIWINIALLILTGLLFLTLFEYG